MTDDNTKEWRERMQGKLTEAYYDKAMAETEVAALRHYGTRVRDLLVTTYQLAIARFYDTPSANMPTEWAKRLNDVAESMRELGIEV